MFSNRNVSCPIDRPQKVVSGDKVYYWQGHNINSVRERQKFSWAIGSQLSSAQNNPHSKEVQLGGIVWTPSNITEIDKITRPHHSTESIDCKDFQPVSSFCSMLEQMQVQHQASCGPLVYCVRGSTWHGPHRRISIIQVWAMSQACQENKLLCSGNYISPISTSLS